MDTSRSGPPRFLAALSIALVVATAACGGDGNTGDASPAGDDGSGGDVVAEGRTLYEETCAACHGTDLKGTATGPPLLDVIYEPNHHPDESFYAAVANGVQPHHWDFGPMPPQPNVSPDDVAAIVAYVRAEQKEAGIFE